MTLAYADGFTTLHQGDVLDVLRQLPADQFQTCMTSPPYWGLRQYATCSNCLKLTATSPANAYRPCPCRWPWPDMELWPVILDLCGGTGSWSKPYADAGYDVRVVTLPQDVRLVEWQPLRVHGILAAPPCTVFASSGARWPRTNQDYIEALSIVDACLRAVVVYKPEWWALENPVGKLTRWLGKPRMYFDPCDYGDPYTKRTALWGEFTVPDRRPVQISHEKGSSPIHRMGPGPDRAALRSITPAGFAQAFFQANP